MLEMELVSGRAFGRGGGNPWRGEILTCRIHHHLSASPAFDVGNSDEGKEEIGDAVAGCEEACHAIPQSYALGEHGW